ncbi:hypothetical protein FBU30_003526 [Linnemannia zychae]|nr:hypothetical protein FBU30_003526 [Linnemannia zychae]
MEDDFEEEDELFSEALDDGRDKGSNKKQHQHSGFTLASKHLQQRAKRSGEGSGSGAKTRRAPVEEEEDAGQDDTEDRGPTFRPETLHVQKEALEMSSEFLRLFTIEALHRTATYQREQEDEELKNDEILIELDSLEAIIPQLVMDF